MFFCNFFRWSILACFVTKLNLAVKRIRFEELMAKAEECSRTINIVFVNHWTKSLLMQLTTIFVWNGKIFLCRKWLKKPTHNELLLLNCFTNWENSETKLLEICFLDRQFISSLHLRTLYLIFPVPKKLDFLNLLRKLKLKQHKTSRNRISTSSRKFQ